MSVHGNICTNVLNTTWHQNWASVHKSLVQHTSGGKASFYDQVFKGYNSQAHKRTCDWDVTRPMSFVSHDSGRLKSSLATTHLGIFFEFQYCFKKVIHWLQMIWVFHIEDPKRWHENLYSISKATNISDFDGCVVSLQPESFLASEK